MYFRPPIVSYSIKKHSISKKGRVGREFTRERCFLLNSILQFNPMVLKKSLSKKGRVDREFTRERCFLLPSSNSILWYLKILYIEERPGGPRIHKRTLFCTSILQFNPIVLKNIPYRRKAEWTENSEENVVFYFHPPIQSYGIKKVPIEERPGGPRIHKRTLFSTSILQFNPIVLKKSLSKKGRVDREFTRERCFLLLSSNSII